MGRPMAVSQDQHDDESRQERVNRELIELLNELRVALPGVQVLFAFLLAVPFSQGFTDATGFQKDLFFATLGMTTLSVAMVFAVVLIADYLYKSPMPIIAGVVAAAFFAYFWFAFPLARAHERK